MDPWLESLSEDWIPQPRSSSPRAPEGSQIQSENTASREPMSCIASLRGSRRGSATGGNTDRALCPLGDIDDARLNSIKGRRTVNNCENDRAANSDPRYPADDGRAGRKAARTISASSIQTSQAYHTIQHKSFSSSPPKHRQRDETPEWKRRLLGPEACAEKCDLFGPLPLENIFRSPPKLVDPRARVLPVRLNDDMPSSPPALLASWQKLRGKPSSPSQAVDLTPNPSLLIDDSSIGSRCKGGSSSAIYSAAESSLSSNEQRNEEISPIVVSRPGTIDLRADRGLSHPSSTEKHSVASRGAEHSAGRLRTDKTLLSPSRTQDPSHRQLDHRHSLSSVTGLSSTSTDDFISRGGFINFRRGGRSEDDSFQKRSLSPVSLPANQDFSLDQGNSFDEGTPTASHTARSLGRAASRRNNATPSTPTSPLPIMTAGSSTPLPKNEIDGQRSSGSPLKLFGDHDTFTQNKLLRTMNQWEQSIYHADTDEPINVTGSEGAASKQHSRKAARQRARVASFGKRELDEYRFEADAQSYLPVAGAQCIDRVPDRDRPNEGSSRASHVPGEGGASESQRRSSIDLLDASAGESARIGKCPHVQSQIQRSVVAQEEDQPTSGGKDRGFKRRRTLSISDLRLIRGRNETAEYVEQSRIPLGPLIGKKRKESLHYTTEQSDPELMAMRHILSARIPSRASQSGRRRSSLAVFDRVNGGPVERQRKVSPTTQDFFDDALKAMELIRANGKLQSGLGSLNESEADVTGDRESRGSFERGGKMDSGTRERQSSVDEFSRPPSREGGRRYLPPLYPQTQCNPRTLSYLKKFAETSTSGDLRTSSLRSLDSRDPKKFSSRGPLPSIAQAVICEAASDPPGIRITVRPDLEQGEGGAAASVGSDGHASNGVQSASSNPSVGRTGTGTGTGTGTNTDGSSGRSTRHVIAPETVSHLLSKEVGSMTLDQTTQKWIKRTKVRDKNHPPISLSLSSDDDPFGNIPDLPVDPAAEALRLQAVADRAHADDLERTNWENNESLGQEQAVESDGPSQSIPSPPPAPMPLPLPLPLPLQASSRPTTREGETCTPSKFSHLTSTGSRPETRATSWGTEPMASPSKGTGETLNKDGLISSSDQVELNPEIEHEIKANEDRLPEPDLNDRHHFRDVTITFSSPVAHVIGTSPDESAYDDSEFPWPEDTQFRFDDSDSGRSMLPDNSCLSQHATRSRNSRVSSRSYHRGTSRRISFGGRNYSMTRCPPIDEQNEDASDNSNQSRRACSERVSMDVSLTTPLKFTKPDQPLQGNKGERRVVNLSFHLSPLADFTMNPTDDREARAVQVRIAHPSTRQSHVAPSNALSTLVEILTDVEPLEPYWEDIRQLDLRGRGLISMRDLEHFCGNVEELDVSENALDQLSGVPSSLRQLMVANNRLSSLSAWGHLTNLQCLDISGNGLESLDALRCLRHLRELRVDDNKLKTLEGIFSLDSLTVLRARRNLLNEVDFTDADLPRLSDLDLRSNYLTSITSLHQLPSLTHLDLTSNELYTFSPPLLLPNLQSLTLPRNKLASIPLDSYPALRLLYLDENRLAEPLNLHKLRHLRILSLRDQRDVATTPTLHHPPSSLHKLYLSGLPPHPSLLTPSASHPSLYPALHTLELASTSLTTLPPTFTASFPQLRTLNLNFNALRSLSPLRTHPHLSKLLLAGNRLSRLRRTTTDLSTLPCLRTLDLRHNPLTIGFHPPPQPVPQQSQQPPSLANTTTTTTTAPRVLQPADPPRDAIHRQKMIDHETASRRTVYEVLLAHRCASLHILDGLRFDAQHARVAPGLDEGVASYLREVGLVFESGGNGSVDGQRG